MVATGRSVDAGWESMVYLVAGAPVYREELERLQACVNILFHLKAWQILVFWVSAALSVGEQLVEVLLSVSADAVSTYLFMPCVPRFVLRAEDSHALLVYARRVSNNGVFFSTFTGNKHSQFFFHYYFKRFRAWTALSIRQPLLRLKPWKKKTIKETFTTSDSWPSDSTERQAACPFGGRLNKTWLASNRACFISFEFFPEIVDWGW